VEELSFPDASNSPMQRAIDGIVQYLGNSDSAVFADHRLTDVVPTMKTLLQGIEMAKKFEQE